MTPQTEVVTPPKAPSRVPLTVYFRDSAPFLGESQSASEGMRGVIDLQPGYHSPEGLRIAGPKDRCDGCLVRYQSRNAKGEMVTKQCLVPYESIRGIGE